MQDQRRRQQRKACDFCRGKKIRCDIISRDGPSCTACEKARLECRSTTKWATPRRGPHKTRRSYANDQDAPPALEAQGLMDVHDHEPQPASLLPLPSPQPPLIPSPSQHEPPGEQLARSGLARFFRHGIGAAWAVFGASSQTFRIAYVGTAVSNLVHLVDLHRSFRLPFASATDPHPHSHRPLSSTTAQETSLDGSSESDPLHYPYPPIRQAKPWKPSASLWGIPSTQDLAVEVSSFPAQDVRDALVTSYFEHVHPFLPIISPPEFLASYRNPSSPPPLLLFQAVLMAGAHACTHPLVANDRHAVKSVLFRRASMLFHMRHEADRMHLMQAAALFTWHVGDGDTVAGGPWYWAGIAVRVGVGLGAHRFSKHLPQAETSQYRRCWWSVFVCEVFSSLETGRPCAIRAEDIDQLPLTEEDMTDTPSQDPLSFNPETDSLSFNCETSPSFLNRMVELAYIGLDIMALNAPSQDKLVDIGSINARLGLWSLRSGISSVSDADSAATCHLRMHYNLTLLHLHRNAPNGPGSRSICSAAAKATSASLERLAARDEVRRCHFTAVGAVTAVGIQFAGEIRAAVTGGEFLVAIHALEQLARLLRSAAALARHWPNAEAVHNVFEELHQEYHTLVTQHLQGEQVMVPETSPDWNRLFAGESVQLNGLATDQAWLNIANWADLL